MPHSGLLSPNAAANLHCEKRHLRNCDPAFAAQSNRLTLERADKISFVALMLSGKVKTP